MFKFKDKDIYRGRIKGQITEEALNNANSVNPNYPKLDKSKEYTKTELLASLNVGEMSLVSNSFAVQERYRLEQMLSKFWNNHCMINDLNTGIEGHFVKNNEKISFINSARIQEYSKIISHEDLERIFWSLSKSPEDIHQLYSLVWWSIDHDDNCLIEFQLACLTKYCKKSWYNIAFVSNNYLEFRFRK